MIAVAKITAKGQTTIPQDVRAALHVSPGDLIAWEVGAEWNDISKGMGMAPSYDDEAQMRSFWKEWNRRIQQAAAAKGGK